MVVSGMAKGVDAAAMRGALRFGGFTCGVLGGGVDVVYPAENRRLYEDIAATGVLLSEYPPQTEPEEQRLVLRALATDTPKLSDQLAEETGLPIQRVLPALTLLEISGWAAQNGARSFVRTVALPPQE